MTREMLFKGKRLDNGEWVEGNLFILKQYQSDIDHYYILPKNTVCLFCDIFYYAVEVDPSTVGQFTGLCDKKNGKKIFEGDIVNFTRINALGYTTRRTGVVRYYDKLPVFYIKATTGDAWDWCVCEDIEVIGNVVDNAELLEE